LRGSFEARYFILVLILFHKDNICAITSLSTISIIYNLPVKVNFAFREFSPSPRKKEGLWGKKNPERSLTEGQVKIDENSMIQATTAPTGEPVKTEDIGKTADLLEASRISSPDIFLPWTHSKGDAGQQQFVSAVVTE
jgi:hypothetical protein